MSSFGKAEVPPQTSDPIAAPARGGLSPNAIPKPTYHPPDPTKKSHARKQPEGHVPRPRNAFILFRCDFVRQKKIPDDIEKDHRNISRIAGTVWRLMSDADKAPWVEMADQEKERHSKAYPGYRYTPAPGMPIVMKRKKRGDVDEDELSSCGRGSTPLVRGRAPYKGLDPIAVPPYCGVTPVYTPRQDSAPPATSVSTSTPQRPVLQLPPSYLGLRRSSSCPPGAQRLPAVSSTIHTSDCSPETVLVTRDDLARRPSRVTMFQSDFSLASSLSLRPTDPGLAHVSPTTASLNRPQQAVKDVRPEMRTGAYVIDPPGDAPGWDGARPIALDWEWPDSISDVGMRWGSIQGEKKMSINGLFDTHHNDSDSRRPAGPEYAIEHDIHSLPPLPRAFHLVFTNPFSPTASSFTPSSASMPSAFSTHSAPHASGISDSTTHSRSGSETSTVTSIPTPSATANPHHNGSAFANKTRVEMDPDALFARMSLDDSDIGRFAFRGMRISKLDSDPERECQDTWAPIRVPALRMGGNIGDGGC